MESINVSDFFTAVLVNETKSEFNSCFPSEHPDHVEYAIRGVMLSSVAILGLIGNVLCTLTFSRMRRNTSFAFFLLGLSCCDSILAFSSLLIFGLPKLFTEAMEPYGPYILVIGYPILNIAQTCSVYLIVAVTLERYLAICQPLKSRSFYLTSGKRAFLISLGILIFAILFNIPRFMEYQVLHDDSFEPLGYSLCSSSLREDPTFITFYRNYSYNVMMYIIPNILLFVLNALIYREVCKADRIRQSLSHSQRSENSLAFMLVCVVSVFLLCNLLPFVNNLMESFVSAVNPICVYLGDLLATFNSSVNFLIYYAFGKKFRKDFKKTYCSCGSRSNNVSNGAPVVELNEINCSSGSASASFGPVELDEKYKRSSTISVLTDKTDWELEPH